MEISQNRLARDMDVPPRRINEIVHGKHNREAPSPQGAR
jgi:plasmid maintenance system antidote protein VapI